MNLCEVSDLIRNLTKEDLRHKTIFELFAKLAEEAGEFIRELQIEEGTFGNNHKAPDEGTVGEAIDVVIMGLALYHARNKDDKATEMLPELLMKKLKKWKAAHEFEAARCTKIE